MDLSVTAAARSELAAAYLQAVVTLGLVLLCGLLYRRYRKPYFAIWATAWGLYALRLGAIITFLHDGRALWLFWHQVITGWTALALLWAALVFAQRTPWRSRYWVFAALPLVWSYVAIYVLDHFLWAAAPMVAFLSLTTAWTAWAFLRYDRMVRSPAARFLAVVLLLWALHHLDYPLLRARGAWAPWGYYLDIIFETAMGLGILFLVLEDLDEGLRTLTALSGELQRRDPEGEPVTEAFLRRALSLRGVHGSALYLVSGRGGAFVHGAGVAALWPFEGAPGAAVEAAERVRRTALPALVSDSGQATPGWRYPYTAALPILRDDEVVGALVVVGEARDPFTVLDNRFLLAFGQQVGAALANEDLARTLEARTHELERLQDRMVHQHEEERARLWRALHDETAQVLAALNLQLGLLQERADDGLAVGLERAKRLVAEGIRSIRSVTRDLRPMALDDLGLVPSLRALARDFDADEGFTVELQVEDPLPEVEADAEVALYRSLQEALANAVRHAGASRVEVSLGLRERHLCLRVRDDGRGVPDDLLERLRSRGGLAGIRERVLATGGSFEFRNAPGGGAELVVCVPLNEAEVKARE